MGGREEEGGEVGERGSGVLLVCWRWEEMVRVVEGQKFFGRGLQRKPPASLAACQMASESASRVALHHRRTPTTIKDCARTRLQKGNHGDWNGCDCRPHLLDEGRFFWDITPPIASGRLMADHLVL